MRARRFRLIAGTCCLALFAGLLASILGGIRHGPVDAALVRLAADPWGLATLVDVAVGLVAIAAWLWVVEPRPWARAVWIPLLFVLGNLVTLAVLLLRLRHSEDAASWLLRPRRARRDA